MFYNLQFSFWYLFLGSILTYLVWGFVVAFEVILAMSGSESARRWILDRYAYKSLAREVKIFYPMVLLGYLFLEIVPYYLFGVQNMVVFDLEKLFDTLFEDD